VCSKRVSRRRPWTIGLSLLALVLAMLTGAVLWDTVRTSSVLTLEDEVNALSPVLSVLRAGVIICVVALWPRLIRSLAQWHRAGESGIEALVALRWRIGGWLVVLELVLGQNLPAHLIRAVRGLA